MPPRIAKACLKLDPEYKYARGFLAFFRLQCCDWRALDAQRTAIASGVRAGKRVVPPFAAAALLDSAADQLAAARICVADKYPPTTAAAVARGALPAPQDSRRLSLGRFQQHGGREPHGRRVRAPRQVEVRYARHVLHRGRRKRDAHAPQAQLRPLHRSVERQRCRDRRISAAERDRHRRRSDGLHRRQPSRDSRASSGARCRSTISASRERWAPTHIDYILADRIVIPKDARDDFDEAVVHLPDCFMPTDSVRPITHRTPSRAEAGLPADGFVFCSFNNSYKFVAGDVRAVDAPAQGACREACSGCRTRTSPRCAICSAKPKRRAWRATGWCSRRSSRRPRIIWRGCRSPISSSTHARTMRTAARPMRCGPACRC